MQFQPLDEKYIEQAATLYWEAFSNKLHRVLGTRERAIPYLCDSLNLEQSIGILSDDKSQLLALAGFDLGSGGIVQGGLKEIRKHYGLFGSIWRGILLGFLTRTVAPDTLQMDGIAVHKDCRGKGLGTAMLEQMTQIAQANGKSAILLDVIDSNQRAKSLYEREGFVTIETTHMGPLKSIFNFSTSYKMCKYLA